VAAREHVAELGLEPEALLHRPCAVALVDLVHRGLTFESVSDFLLSWAREVGADVPAVHDAGNLEALRFATQVYDRGSERAERLAFAEALASLPEMKFDWVRALVGELRGTASKS
jgi:hypothetical protein